MGRESIKKNKSIYWRIREELGLSRAAAADKMHGFLDHRQLERVEKGERIVNPDDVLAMSRAYQKPELRNYYCCCECAIGKLDVPEVDSSSSVYEILVNMAVVLENVNEKKTRLMEILSDGKVDADETRDFEKISEELEKISATVEALQLWCEKMKIGV